MVLGPYLIASCPIAHKPGREWADGEAAVIHPSCAPRLPARVYLARVAPRVLREYEHGGCEIGSKFAVLLIHTPFLISEAGLGR